MNIYEVRSTATFVEQWKDNQIGVEYRDIQPEVRDRKE